MKTKDKVFIVVAAALLIGIWAILAFFIREDLIERFTLWTNLIIGTSTVILSFIGIFLSYLALKKNKKDNKE